MFGRFDFRCDGCCGYDETIDKANINEVIMEYINEEFNFQCPDEEGGVLYVSLNTWVEGLGLPSGRIKSHRGYFRQHQRRILSGGDSKYFSCRKYKKNKKRNKKKNNSGHFHPTNNITVIDGVEDRHKGASLLLAQTGFGSLQHQ